MDRVIEEYGACVQIVWRLRPLPYHEHARLAARASHEVYRQAGDAAFWRFHDRVFADQDHITRADLVAIAAAVGGVTVEAFERALDSDAHADVIARDAAAIEALPGGMTLGTPSFFVNGTLLRGARSHRTFAYRIEEALADDYASAGVEDGAGPGRGAGDRDGPGAGLRPSCAAGRARAWREPSRD